MLIKKYLQLYYDKVYVLPLGALTKRPLLVSHGAGTGKKVKCRAFALSVTRLLYLTRTDDREGTRALIRGYLCVTDTMGTLIKVW